MPPLIYYLAIYPGGVVLFDSPPTQFPLLSTLTISCPTREEAVIIRTRQGGRDDWRVQTNAHQFWWSSLVRKILTDGKYILEVVTYSKSKYSCVYD